jgi:hypothetical protein
MKTSQPLTALDPIRAALIAFVGSMVVAATLFDASPVFAQNPGQSNAAPQKTAPTRDELEARFKAVLTQATLTGRWCGIKDGKLGSEKEDKYTITAVTKIGGDAWMIHARIQYGQKDFVAPIPVLVKWAGDTPVLTLDNVGLPGGESYSARVLIYQKTYAGTWSGGDHAGLLSGIITNEPADPAAGAH